MTTKKKLAVYNPQHHAVVSNKVFEKNRYKLSTHAQRLLFTLIQNIDTSIDLFPEWEIDMNVIFKYMGLENTNQRYEIVKDAFFEMAKNPLEEESYRTKTGIAKWKVIPWFGAEFDPDNSNCIKITFQPLIKPYLLKLKDNFCQIKISYLKKLSTQYSTWLYPLLKSQFDKKKQYAQVVVFEISIQRLKEWVYVEEEKSYDPKKTSGANRNFIRKIIGIERDRKTDTWDYITLKYQTKSEGMKEKKSGTIYEISEKTDIKVQAIALKTGKSYDRIQFTVVGKDESKKVNTKKTPKADPYREKQIATYEKNFNNSIKHLEELYERLPTDMEVVNYYEKEFKQRLNLTHIPPKEPTIVLNLRNPYYVVSIVNFLNNTTLFQLKDITL